MFLTKLLNLLKQIQLRSNTVQTGFTEFNFCPQVCIIGFWDQRSRKFIRTWYDSRNGNVFKVASATWCNIGINHTKLYCGRLGPNFTDLSSSRDFHLVKSAACGSVRFNIELIYYFPAGISRMFGMAFWPRFIWKSCMMVGNSGFCMFKIQYNKKPIHCQREIVETMLIRKLEVERVQFSIFFTEFWIIFSIYKIRT